MTREAQLRTVRAKPWNLRAAASQTSRRLHSPRPLRGQSRAGQIIQPKCRHLILRYCHLLILSKYFEIHTKLTDTSGARSISDKISNRTLCITVHSRAAANKSLSDSGNKLPQAAFRKNTYFVRVCRGHGGGDLCLSPPGGVKTGASARHPASSPPTDY